MENLITKTEDGKLVVSSRRVADDFGRRHSDVIKAIEDKMKVNEILRSPKYFIESTYTDKSNRKSKEYLLTRDGFSFLVMGFTGSKADEWKLKYIEAFNKMEQAIKNPFAHLSKELQAIIAIDTKVQKIEEDFNTFKSNLPLLNVDCKELQAEVRKKGLKF